VFSGATKIFNTFNGRQKKLGMKKFTEYVSMLGALGYFF